MHSYYFDCEKSEDQLARFEYGGHALTAAVIKDNVVGVQFHPEKSSDPGLSVLDRFISR